MEKKEARRFRATKREILFSSAGAKRTMRRREREKDDKTAGDRDRGRQREEQRKKERERERRREGGRGAEQSNQVWRLSDHSSV